MAEILKKNQLSELKDRCSALEDQMNHIRSFELHDQLAVQRLKRQSVKLKEQIHTLQSHLRPDIIA